MSSLRRKKPLNAERYACEPSRFAGILPEMKRQSGDASHTALNPEVMYPRLLSRLSHSRFHHLAEKYFPMFAWTNRHFARLRNDPADIIHIHNFHGGCASVEALANLARTKRVIRPSVPSGE
jgi:hypothetical protein